MIITIPFKTESQNKFQYSHWRKYHAYKQQWLMAIREHIAPQKPEKVKRKVIITSYRKRLCDRVNFEAGAKPILDSLKHWGLIYDDSIEWVDDKYFQEKSKEEKTVIEIL